MKLTTDTVGKTLAALGEIMNNASVKSGSTGKYDFFAGRLRVACTSGKLLSTINRFGELLGSPVLRGTTTQGLMSAAAAEDADSCYIWLREQPSISISMATASMDNRPKMITDFCAAYEPRIVKNVQMHRRRPFDIGIIATLENAFTHGDDKKAGNNTLFRRGSVRGGQELPYYSANAWAGQMRDLFAKHFVTALGYDTKSRERLFAPWFLHLLTSGGIMADGAIPKLFEAALTGNVAGAIKVNGAIQLRNMIPYFSLLGGVGKSPLEGRVYINDLRPQCVEWGNGDESVEMLMDWRYIVNRDDLENKISKLQAKETGNGDMANKSMIANYECLIEGAVLEGGIDVDLHITDVEISALAKGLEMMQQFGYLGGKVHRGFGRATIEYQSKLTLNGSLYNRYLADNKQAIIDYLRQIGGFASQKQSDN